MFSAITAAFVVVYPGLHAWWSSRKLLRHLDDPLLPDLILRRSQGVSWALAVALGVGVLAAGPYFGLLLAGALAGVAIGVFPARRRIFEESWSLGAYLSHVARFYLGNFGAVLLLAFLPQVLRTAGIWAGAATGLFLLGYGAFASRVFPVLLRAKRLDRPELDTPFERILTSARSRRPCLFEADAPGGTWVNAFALPSPRGPAVLFTRGLLDALDPDETTAIFAHEVAHLEHYHPRRLWVSRLATLSLVALVVFVWEGPFASWLTGFEWVWTVAILLASTLRAKHGARHEAESDLRAVELGGDPEALVRGLTKIHTLGRIARRYSEWTEKHATHPSLAKRIQSIRAAAKVERVFELEPRLFIASDRSGRGVVLDAERLHWLSGIPEGSFDPLSQAAERRSLRYPELRELRIDASVDERALVFMEASGATTRMPVAAAETSRLQEALDAVDDQLGYRSPAPAPATGRLASALVMLLSLISQSFALVPLAALAFCLPAQATLAALGASGLLSSILELLRPDASPLAATPIRIALVAFGSLGCLAVAWRQRRNDPPSRVAAFLALLLPLGVAGFALPASVFIPTSPLPVMHAHLWARSHPAVPIGLVGVAAALFTLRGAKARAGGVAALAATAAVLALGSLPARELGSKDVFRAPGTTLEIVPAELEVRRELDVPGAVFAVALSPRGERVAVGTYRAGSDAYEGLAELVFQVETGRGELVTVPALDLEWWDEERVLLVAEKDEQSTLQLVNPASGSVVSEVELPPLVEVELFAEPSTRRFQVTGRTPQERDLVVVRGELGRGVDELLRFGVDEQGTSPDVVSAEGVGLEIAFVMPQLGSSFAAWSWAYEDAYRYLVRRLSLRRPGASPDGVGSTALDVVCSQGAPSGHSFSCVVAEDGRTSFWSLDPETGRWTSAGVWEGRLYAATASADQQLLLLGAGDGPVLVDLGGRRAIATRLPRLSGGRAEPSLLGLLYRWEPAVPVIAAAFRTETMAVANPWDPRTETSRVTVYALGRDDLAR